MEQNNREDLFLDNCKTQEMMSTICRLMLNVGQQVYTLVDQDFRILFLNTNSERTMPSRPHSIPKSTSII